MVSLLWCSILICHWSLPGEFSLSELRFMMCLVDTCCSICFLLSGSHVAAMLINGATTVGVYYSKTYGVYPWHIYRGSIMLLIQLTPSHSSIPWNMGGLAESHPIPPTFLYGRDGSFLGCVPPSDIVNSKSVLGVKHDWVSFTHS